MKTAVKIQELSDGRFRNSVTGEIGDSIGAVVGINDDAVDQDLKALNMLEKRIIEAVKITVGKKVASDFQIPLKKIMGEVRNKRDGILK